MQRFLEKPTGKNIKQKGRSLADLPFWGFQPVHVIKTRPVCMYGLLLAPKFYPANAASGISIMAGTFACRASILPMVAGSIQEI